MTTVKFHLIASTFAVLLAALTMSAAFSTRLEAAPAQLEKVPLCSRTGYEIYEPPVFIQGERIAIKAFEREEFKGCQKVFAFDDAGETDPFIFAVFLSSERIEASQRDAFAVFITETFRKGQDTNLTIMPERTKGSFREFRFSVAVKGQSAMDGDISRMSFLDVEAGTLVVYSSGPLTVLEALLKTEKGEENAPSLPVRKAMYVKLWHNANLELLNSQ
ncbi:hypothetical protein J2T09_001686 [Neorhizobium huautlense]|uniref:Chalcone isomerase domain-containing protein n=1 Tax=Neorhizobium huautlense TaxID=67774 RepID=A0ABT9PR44_9HYPH|nr:hypothetical protein [Neorhizobium huautlense]MDP9836941.1 hypothetical protein [Neorhizobium huautlense]